jgi:hypothetical protein
MRVVLVLLTVLASAPLAAQDQSHIDAAKELLDLMNADQSIEQAYEQIYPHMQAMADQLGATDEQRPIFDRYVEKMVAVMKEELSWEKMEPLMLNAYVDVYSEEELRELNEFYASPLGQKFIHDPGHDAGLHPEDAEDPGGAAGRAREATGRTAGVDEMRTLIVIALVQTGLLLAVFGKIVLSDDTPDEPSLARR